MTITLTSPSPVETVDGSAADTVDAPRIAPAAAAALSAAGYEGALYQPGDADFDRLRTPWNVAVDQRPAAVAYPTSTEELAAAVSAAGAAGLRVAMQGTGHAAGALPDLAGALLIRTDAMRGVHVDPERALVRVQAGALWEDVTAAVAGHGLSVLHGSSPDVGVVGYSLGGGLGWFARRFGLQAHAITAATVVTAKGSILRVDADRHPELLWGLRGGGGNFVAVAELEFRAFRFTRATAGWLVWDWSHAPAVVREWARWSVSAPDAVTTSLRLLQLPPIPEIPEPMRGRRLVAIDGAVLADPVESARILAPLRALGPELDTFADVHTSTLGRLHMDPEGPTPAVSDSTLLSGLPEAAIQAFLAAAGPDSGSQLLAAEIRQLGGALARPAEIPAALPGIAAPFALFAVGIAPTPEMGAAAHRNCARLTAAMASWASGQYLNFAEYAVDASLGFPAGHWDRLRALRGVWDPAEVFLASHRIPVPSAP